MTPLTDVDHAVDELYARPPAEFVAARDELVRQARAAGDKEAAAAIAALRKPTLPAWVLNVLVRQERRQVAEFVELGPALREASAALEGPQLRQLSARRHQLVQALVRQARALARDAGQRVGEDVLRGVEETLHAALADPDVAAAVLGGRLTHPVSATGFASVPATMPHRQDAPVTKANPAATGREGSASTAGRRSRTAARRAELEDSLAEAWAAARAAADERDRATTRAADAERRATEVNRDVTRLSAEVEALRGDLVRAEQQLAERQAVLAEREAARREAAERLHQAEAAADQARRRVSDLQGKLESLGTG